MNIWGRYYGRSQYISHQRPVIGKQLLTAQYREIWQEWINSMQSIPIVALLDRDSSLWLSHKQSQALWERFRRFPSWKANERKCVQMSLCKCLILINISVYDLLKRSINVPTIQTKFILEWVCIMATLNDMASCYFLPQDPCLILPMRMALVSEWIAV